MIHWLLLSILLGMALLSWLGTGLAAEPLPLEDAVALPDQSIGYGKSVELGLPALPARAGKVVVLSFRAFVRTEGAGGCNWNATVSVNGATPGRFTASGTERLVGRSALLELLPDRRPFSVFGGDKLMIIYANTADQADAVTADGLGGTFNLDISDLVRGVDQNTLRFTNHYLGPQPEGLGDLVVQDLRVGWLDRAKLPTVGHHAPRRGPVGEWRTVSGVRLGQSAQGGFVVAANDGPDLLVETALSMDHEAASALVADDSAEVKEGPELAASRLGEAGFRLEARWPQVTLTRELAVHDGLVVWRETWTNTGAETAGVPIRHRLFLREVPARFHVAGSLDNVAVASTPANPTLFMEPTSGDGPGYGLTVESDWWRLLHAQRVSGDVAEVYTNCLALAAGKSLELEMTITPVGAGGGYWAFINSVRRRWGANGLTMQRPMFWGWTRKQGLDDPVEAIKASLGHLGPVAVVVGPWQRLQPDCYVVRDERYPKLPDDAPRTIGRCPDLDLDAFLTFAHREAYWTQVTNDTAMLHEAIPGIQVIHMTHPAMECIYRPLEDRWPIAADAIKTPEGKTFEDAGYTKAWLGSFTEKDWGVLYYVPRPGSAQMQAYIAGAERAMDECGADGMYSDEFSWAFMSRGYSRYDYSRWDGYSADLDENGKVLRLKADGGAVTEACQQAMLQACRSRGKFFLGNGGSALRSINNIPHHRFVEGGNGPSWYGQGHLSAVPLILGNMGDETTTSGVFASVRLCLAYGAVYVPVGCNLLLEGTDNFVSKLYPITVQEIGPGFVVGQERLITTVSRFFDWPGVAGKVKLYRYDRNGTRIDAEAEVETRAGEPLAIQVPEEGLVVAERE